MSGSNDEASRYRHLVFEGVKLACAMRPPRREVPRVPKSASVAVGLPGRREERPIAPKDLWLLRRVFERAGLEMASYRMAPLARRIPACLRATGARSREEAGELIGLDPARLSSAVDALVLGVTEFFRDQSVFDQLRDEIIPRLLRGDRRPRVWSVGCSVGAELYSTAMLFAEQGGLERAEFYGSDCRPAAIETARAGVYPADQLKEVSAQLVERYCERRGNLYEMRAELKAAIRWEVRDVFGDMATGRWDLILCRNLAIYLHGSAAKALWEKLARAMSADSVLVVGKAEKPTVSGLRRVAPCLFVKE